MYQSYVYLETRVLLSAVPGVFVSTAAESAKKDILSAKAVFLKRNNSRSPVGAVSIQPAALHKVAMLARALGGTMLEKSELERLTGSIQEPPDDKEFTGFSVKVATGGDLDIMECRHAVENNIMRFAKREVYGNIDCAAGLFCVDNVVCASPSPYGLCSVITKNFGMRIECIVLRNKWIEYAERA